MRQEDINSMMRYPWESKSEVGKIKLPLCPSCNEAYCGDGVKPCVDCNDKNNEMEQ